MVVRNNYSWLEDESKNRFINCGDIIKIKHIKKYEELYGLSYLMCQLN